METCSKPRQGPGYEVPRFHVALLLVGIGGTLFGQSVVFTQRS